MGVLRAHVLQHDKPAANAAPDPHTPETEVSDHFPYSFYLVSVITLFLSTNTLCFILFNWGFISDPILFLYNIATNFLLVLSYIASGMYIHMSFSGLPYISDMHCNQLNLLRRAFIFWGLGRFCSGCTDILFILFFDG